MLSAFLVTYLLIGLLLKQYQKLCTYRWMHLIHLAAVLIRILNSARNSQHKVLLLWRLISTNEESSDHFTTVFYQHRSALFFHGYWYQKAWIATDLSIIVEIKTFTKFTQYRLMNIRIYGHWRRTSLKEQKVNKIKALFTEAKCFLSHLSIDWSIVLSNINSHLWTDQT